MASERDPHGLLPYIVVEAEDEVRQDTNTTLGRWVIVDGHGQTVSAPVPRQSAFKWCAALMWWLAAPEEELLEQPGVRTR
jgi:hypothetical protein